MRSLLLGLLLTALALGAPAGPEARLARELRAHLEILAPDRLARMLGLELVVKELATR
ncbi:MAG: hypothetical protein AMXMBFR33_40690 [Candidatus Xenobia bacterium]